MNEQRNSILMTCYYPDLGNTSHWLKQISYAALPIRSTTQIWEVIRHQYGNTALVPQSHFAGKPVTAPRKVGCFLRLLNLQCRAQLFEGRLALNPE